MQYKNLKRTVMKKALLFAVSICCMISALAQNVNNYTQKLDSVCYGSAVERLQYDERLNCTQIKYVYDDYGQEEVYSTHNFAYDNENRVVRDEYIEMTGVYNLYENTYNEQGLITQRIRTMRNYDELMGLYKYTYEYDTEGNLLTTKGFNINENNEWIESYRNEYLYREDGLLVAMKHYISYISGDSWLYEVTDYYYNEEDLCIEVAKHRGETDTIAKTLYTYDETGHKSSEIKMLEEFDTLAFKEKTEWEYDMDGNCIKTTCFGYYNSTETWLFIASYEYNYNYESSTTDIAGLLTYWNNSYFDNSFEPAFKILNCQATDLEGVGVSNTTTFHYSENTGIGENPEKQVGIWPNPVLDMLNIGVEDLQQVEIFTLDGKLVLFSNSKNSLCVSGLAEGCYLLKVTQADGSICFQRFVKE